MSQENISNNQEAAVDSTTKPFDPNDKARTAELEAKYEGGKEQEELSKKTSSEVSGLLWKVDTSSAEVLLSNAREKGITLNISNIVNDSIKSILQDISATTFDKVDIVVDFAKKHGVEVFNLQSFYQQAFDNRAKGHPSNMTAFLKAMKERGVEVNFDAVGTAQRNLIASYLTYDTIQTDAIMDVLKFAKENNIDLGDVKSIITEARAKIANTGDIKIIILNNLLSNL
ncbi:MAG: hypothetical protein KBC41_04385 [Candidatus Pacebacteria bacterium]|nr:hypothetical protein [Candidatus Paceibacterota bacterium]MBP9867282.1 hypothetical protein [Candidatus Paceibacterota bacterium]